MTVAAVPQNVASARAESKAALHDSVLLHRWTNCRCGAKAFRARTFAGAVVDVCTSCGHQWPVGEDGLPIPLRRPHPRFAVAPRGKLGARGKGVPSAWPRLTGLG